MLRSKSAPCEIQINKSTTFLYTPQYHTGSVTCLYFKGHATSNMNRHMRLLTTPLVSNPLPPLLSMHKLTCMLAPGPGAPMKIQDNSKWLSPGGIKYGAFICLWSSSPILGSDVLLQEQMIHICTYVEHNGSQRRIPYSRKFLRDRIFAVFMVDWQSGKTKSAK